MSEPRAACFGAEPDALHQATTLDVVSGSIGGSCVVAGEKLLSGAEGGVRSR